MSVRRLAKEQPESFAFTPASLEQAVVWLGKFPESRKQSAVIPLLWLVQKQEGWVPEPALRVVAEMIGTPVIRVFENVTFYTMFQLQPVGSTAHIGLCGTTPCELRGAKDLKRVLEARIGPREHRSADGRFSWEEVECMGACANAPMVAINDYYYEDLTPEALDRLITDFADGKTPAPGSSIGRQGSAPEGGRDHPDRSRPLRRLAREGDHSSRSAGMSPRVIRTAGLLAVLFGVLLMAAARFGHNLPPSAIWIGLAILVCGWGLILYTLVRRDRGLTR